MSQRKSLNLKSIMYYLSVSPGIFGFLVFAVLPSVKSSAANIDSILGARNLHELERAIVDARTETIQRRACEIQRRQGLPPTACYGVDATEKDENSTKRSQRLRELDRECLRTVASAKSLPAVDRFTSKVCRDAVESRTLDLAYAGGRDALRYP